MRETVPLTNDFAPPRPDCCSEFPFCSCPDEGTVMVRFVDNLADLVPRSLDDLLDIADLTIEVTTR